MKEDRIEYQTNKFLELTFSNWSFLILWEDANYVASCLDRWWRKGKKTIMITQPSTTTMPETGRSWVRKNEGRRVPCEPRTHSRMKKGKLQQGVTSDNAKLNRPRPQSRLVVVTNVKDQLSNFLFGVIATPVLRSTSIHDRTALLQKGHQGSCHLKVATVQYHTEIKWS